MSPEDFRRGIENMDDEHVQHVMDALARARATAMRQTVQARVPECGDFGLIAQDLDATISDIAIAAAEDVDASAPLSRSTLTDQPATPVKPSDMPGLPTT